MNHTFHISMRPKTDFHPRLSATVTQHLLINCRHQAAVLLCHASSCSSTWCANVACQCKMRRHLSLGNATVLSGLHGGTSTWTRTTAQVARAQRQLHIAYCNPNDDHSNSHSELSSRDGGGSSGGSGAGGGNSSGSGDGKLPAWYKVWMWATALTYLVWRWKWRRDRKLAAEQFAKEQQVEQQLKQDWDRFAQRYGVVGPQEAGH